ncbi:flagellar biosynthetic protein FliO [Curvibacter sp. APW13]|uniref:FliO/MopB family protein n=1 Tax=Curvibacter sp. APW13 TaxID=3077236 RepID=UPI0028DE75F6|nr:flagellar biosynthetic protein FliO [Curvibacter sp. APW13]MDT8992911.1 flagellar biosynthetic protein FliO [Curvibacter sp. APW13]
MTDSLILLVLFVVAIASLPWGVRRLQARFGVPAPLAGGRVVSALAVGPQQRIVTVQVNCGSQELTMVLGVTSASVTCLHKWGGGAPLQTSTDAPMESGGGK